jgi:hypothetical protein
MLLDTANEVIMAGMRFTRLLSAAGLICHNSHKLSGSKEQNHSA